MIIDLVLTVCMVSDPSSCHEQRLAYESRGSLATCMMLSTPYIAMWAGDHPDLKVTSWKCEWPEERKNPI